MASIDQVANAAYDLCWARGDDDPKTFTISDASGVVDISGWTLALAVNTDLNPDNITNEIFRVVGTFVTDGTDGKILFTPPATSLDAVTAPGQAYYDINRTAPSKKTIIKGKVVFAMDIDKA
tara:strand:+ start:8820 stop:9185 length:366 start_codon:yes stop_codon:yes gene_type:complete